MSRSAAMLGLLVCSACGARRVPPQPARPEATTVGWSHGLMLTNHLARPLSVDHIAWTALCAGRTTATSDDPSGVEIEPGATAHLAVDLPEGTEAITGTIYWHAGGWTSATTFTFPVLPE